MTSLGSFRRLLAAAAFCVALPALAQDNAALTTTEDVRASA